MEKNLEMLETTLLKKIKINTDNQNNKIKNIKNKIMPSTNTSTIQVKKRDGRNVISIENALPSIDS